MQPGSQHPETSPAGQTLHIASLCCDPRERWGLSVQYGYRGHHMSEWNKSHKSHHRTHKSNKSNKSNMQELTTLSGVSAICDSREPQRNLQIGFRDAAQTLQRGDKWAPQSIKRGQQDSAGQEQDLEPSARLQWNAPCGGTIALKILKMCWTIAHRKTVC